VNERRHEPLFGGFQEMSARRRELAEELVSRRRAVGLSQTEVAARMRTSQSAVARLESGDADVRLSTLERYAAALGASLDFQLRDGPSPGGADRQARGRLGSIGMKQGPGSPASGRDVGGPIGRSSTARRRSP
jgi:ribosome-binding protein aMBF1 (putative translation factor)